MVALIRHGHRDLVPDELRVTGVVEDISLQDVAVRDGNVTTRKRVPGHPSSELAEQGRHEGDLGHVSADVVDLDPVAELVESPGDQDAPPYQVQKGFLEDDNQGSQGQTHADGIHHLAAKNGEENGQENRGPDEVADQLEERVDVRLVCDLRGHQTAEDRLQQLEDELCG